MTLSEPNPQGQHRGRIDFILTRVDRGDGEREGEIAISLEPDPRRYDVIERDGETHYRDKYLGHLISEDVMRSALAAQLERLPLYTLSPSIKDAPAYATARRGAVALELAGGAHQPPHERSKPHARFEDNDTPRDAVFLSVDVVGGSAERRADPEAFERRYRILLQELGTVVGLFNGAIHKLTGDGFIAVIDFPAFTLQCDNAVDLGLTLLRVLHETINPALQAANLKPLAIRVGADYGLATFRSIGVPSTDYRQIEIASDALNRAVKIEQACGPDEFRIGNTLFEILHVQWLERAEEVPFDGETVGWPNYRTYRMR